ncbi:MAG: hypothetical protein IPH99_02495 [Xanthomonadales bacterium]|nr:hypothetical protein [Xanthomonadales bacterium]
MRCVERTFEYMDGLVFVCLLRSRQIDAQLFDENIVRQNWFHILVYGGFRVMVPAHDLQAAGEVLVEFRSGVLRCDDDEMDRPTCPACHAQSGEFDHRQRRWVFHAGIVLWLAPGLVAEFLRDPLIPFFFLSSAFWLAMSMPWLLRFIVHNRLRCAECAHAWRDLPRVPFGRQQRDAEEALTVQGA